MSILPWIKPIKELRDKVNTYNHREYGKQSC